ncbi:MAG: P-loop NTPase, partial [Saprospiraceae bacterium]
MNISKDTIIELLAGVRDPNTAQSIVDMGYVKEVHFEGQFVNISLEIGKLDATQKSDLNFACMLAIQDTFPELSVNVHLISSQQESSTQNAVLPQVANVIAIASGKGGVGKSTIAVNLALGLKKLGARVGIMDADLYGPSIPTMLHLQNKRPKVQEVYGKPKMIPLEAFGMPVISIGNIVEPEQAVVLRGPRLAGIIKQFVQETIWPPLDYLILDLPPGTGDIQLTLVQTLPITGVILVTTPQEVAMADAIKA